MNKNIEKYNKIFIKNFKIKENDLKKDIKYNSIKEWDSVGHMSLISKIEDEFKITMKMDDVIDFSSYKIGLKILKRYKIKL